MRKEEKLREMRRGKLLSTLHMFIIYYQGRRLITWPRIRENSYKPDTTPLKYILPIQYFAIGNVLLV